MKVLKRNYGHRNLVLFLIFSVVYLQAVYSLSLGQTFFSILSLRNSFFNHYLVFSTTIITCLLILTAKKYSERFLLASLLMIVGKNFLLFANSFNKLTLVLSFIYLLFAFYFYITWELEVGRAAINPNFSINDLEKESRFKIKATISLNENKQENMSALVTNIDNVSCFLLLPKDTSHKLNPSKQYYLESTYEGVRFSHTARIVSIYDRGIGLIYDEAPDVRQSWSELYKVCLERGFVS